MSKNSEQSDECIMNCIDLRFYNDVIISRNNAPISNYGGSFRCNSEYPWCIIEVRSKHLPTVFKKNREKQKKNDGNGNFYAKPTIEIFDFSFKKYRNDNDLSSNDFEYFISRRYLKILPFLIIAKNN
ncbi:Uncharacterized protein FWK35_00002780 [Aphis craccivora]|uniref:Uncharacterized protein n=1 Tax=Aphis craccivora TaxID=307492 RepID=A0A6G0ZE66_APHCR|nr:Uncharacterized protein FWK35_00002780 [Aphis craccivora]